MAFIDDVETMKEGKVQREFYSKLVKADINGKDKVIAIFFFYSPSPYLNVNLGELHVFYFYR